MKKAIQFLLVLVLLAAPLVGCSQPEPAAEATEQPVAEEPAAEEPASSEPVTLTISRWAGPHADDQIEVIKEFEEETGIKVQVDAIDYGQLYQKQVLNMSGKTGEYDLVWAQEIWLPDYAGKGFLADMNPFIEAGVVDGFDLSAYNQSLVKTNTIDGALYGLPTFIQTPILVYNTEMLEAAGIAVPEAWTWEETLRIAGELKEQGSGIALPAKQGMAAVDVWAALMRSNGGDYFDADGKLALTQEANIETAEFYKALVDVSMEGSAAWHYDDVNKALQFGQAPIGLTVSGLAGFLEDPEESTVAGKLGYAPLPYSQQTYGTLALWSWCVTADSNHPEEAFRLAAWLTSKETEKKQTLMNGQISAIVSLFNDEELTSQMPWLPAVGAALENSSTQPLGEDAPVLAEAMMEALSAIATGVSDPAAALEAAQEKLASTFP